MTLEQIENSLKKAVIYGKGNINLYNRPIINNSDGTKSTVRSMSFYDNNENKEILVPTAVNGRIVSDEDAIRNYYKTGEYLGKFNTPQQANNYAKKLHIQQDLTTKIREAFKKVGDK